MQIHNDPSTAPSRRADRSPQSRRCLVVGLAVGAAASIAAVAAHSAPGGAATSDGEGFATADAAAEAYVDALAEADLDAALATFAIDTYIDHADFEAHVERLGAYAPHGGMVLPPSNEFNVALGVEQRRSQVATSILNQYVALVNSDLAWPDVTRVHPDEASEFATAMEEAMTPEPLAQLGEFTLVPLREVDADAATSYESESSRLAVDEYRRVLGADEIAAVAVRSSIDGRGVFLVVQAVRYGDEWWIGDLGGHFAVLLGIDRARAGVVWESEVVGDTVP